MSRTQERKYPNLSWRRTVGCGFAFRKGELLWEPIGNRLTPGSHRRPEGLYFVPPPTEPVGGIKVELKGNEKELKSLVARESQLLSPGPPGRDRPSRPRRTLIDMAFDPKVVIDYVLVPRDGSDIRVVSKGREVIPRFAVVENFYFRGGGESRRKILNRLFIAKERPSSDVDSALLRFDAIFAVDTNTYVHRSGARISISSVCRGHLRPLAGDRSVAEWGHVITFVGREPEGNPELSGWVMAISYLLRSGEVGTGDRVALTVDSELRRLGAYNSRMLPLVDSFFLPPSWVLNFATSDAGGREYLPNTMLAGCHKASSMAFRDLRDLDLEV